VRSWAGSGGQPASVGVRGVGIEKPRRQGGARAGVTPRGSGRAGDATRSAPGWAGPVGRLGGERTAEVGEDGPHCERVQDGCGSTGPRSLARRHGLGWRVRRPSSLPPARHRPPRAQPPAGRHAACSVCASLLDPSSEIAHSLPRVNGIQEGNDAPATGGQPWAARRAHAGVALLVSARSHTVRATRVPSRMAWWTPRGATQSPMAWSTGTLPLSAR
jgi:hypothetical protein